MTEIDETREIRAIRYRMAQVADLQHQREHLNALKGAAREPLDLAMQMAKVDSALRVARLALAQRLQSLPDSERLQLIRAHAQKQSEPAS